jgi:DNA invertase Pin-like site-specific DNA recombinase
MNPAHLFLGSQKENVRDRDEKGRTQKGEKHCRSKLTADKVREIHRLRAEGLTLKTIASRFGVSLQQVSDVVRGKYWAHLDNRPTV